MRFGRKRRSRQSIFAAIRSINHRLMRFPVKAFNPPHLLCPSQTKDAIFLDLAGIRKLSEYGKEKGLIEKAPSNRCFRTIENTQIRSGFGEQS